MNMLPRLRSDMPRYFRMDSKYMLNKIRRQKYLNQTSNNFYSSYACRWKARKEGTLHDINIQPEMCFATIIHRLNFNYIPRMRKSQTC